MRLQSNPPPLARDRSETPPLRAALYLRVSTVGQAERGYSLDAQEADCLALAADLGATVDPVHVFRDQQSGADWSLPGLNALLDAAKVHAFDVLCVYDPDRLARNLGKQLVVEEELKRAGITIRYCTVRVGDTPEDTLLKNVRASIAEYERSKIALRTARGRRAKAESGQYVGCGAIPYGYRPVRHLDPRTQKSRIVNLEPDPTTAPIVQRIYDLARTLALAAIADLLNAEGIPGPRSRTWSAGNLRFIVQNPTYKGQAPYGRHPTEGPRLATTWLTVPVPPLVPTSAWETVQVALKGRHLGRSTRLAPENDPYLLRGRLTCGHCGGALRCHEAKRNGKLYRYYVCGRHIPAYAARDGHPVCPVGFLPADLLEARTQAHLLGTLLNPDRLEQRIDQGEAAYTDAMATWEGRRQTLTQEITAHRRKLDALVSDRLDAERGSELRAAIDRRIGEYEQVIARLSAEAEKLAPTRCPGLPPEAAARLRALVAPYFDDTWLLASGLDADLKALGHTVGQRRLLGDLGLQGTVRLDPEHGLPMGARGVRITVDYAASIDLGEERDGAGSLGNGQSLSKLCALTQLNDAPPAVLLRWTDAVA